MNKDEIQAKSDAGINTDWHIAGANINWHKPKWNIYLSDDLLFTTAGHRNWFHRWMMRICLGLRWEKINE